MTWLTEMRVAPTEPLRYIATEFAFELDIVSAMLLTVQDTGPHTHGRTFSTYQLIPFVFFLFIPFFIAHLIVSAIFQASKVGLFAFEALVICQFEKTKVLVLFIVRVPWVLQSLVLIQPFVLTSLYGFLSQVFLVALLLDHVVSYLFRVMTSDSSFALNAIQIVKDYARPRPSFLKDTHHTIQVKDVLTVKLHTWLLT